MAEKVRTLSPPISFANASHSGSQAKILTFACTANGVRKTDPNNATIKSFNICDTSICERRELQYSWRIGEWFGYHLTLYLFFRGYTEDERD